MIPYAFDYNRPNSIEEALQLLGEDSRPLAGGHSLIPALKLRLNQTSRLVDISRIEALKSINLDNSVISIGAAATHASIHDNRVVHEHLPMFSSLAGKIGDVQVRNAGTIGGSLAHADPAADWPAGVLAADASIVVQGPVGKREIAATDFFTGIYSTSLVPGELITMIKVPSMQNKKAHYEKFVQPASRFALVGCAVSAEILNHQLHNVRVAFTGLADVPFRDFVSEQFLEGKPAGLDTAAAAASHRNQDIFVMSDHYADETYRFHLAGVMLSRALKAIL